MGLRIWEVHLRTNSDKNVDLCRVVARRAAEAEKKAIRGDSRLWAEKIELIAESDD